MLNIEEIKNAKHILIKTNNDSFANASAIYSYILTLHKKVSLFHEEEIASKLTFIPWYSKLKKIQAISADLVIESSEDILGYFTFFKSNGIKINQKMATALYSALLIHYDNFKSIETDGMVFAVASQLIEFGADRQIAQKYIVKSDSLALFRLRALLYKSMLLIDEATEVELYISDEELMSSGATLKDAIKIMQDVLSLANVKKVTLKKSDQSMKIIKTIEEV